MKIKKIGYYSSLGLFTIGASAILGFLSFTGMFALWPILPLAIGAFVLSIAYEGEIYLQNIRASLNKLRKKNALLIKLSNEFLLEHYPDTKLNNCPKFFIDYEKKLLQLAKYQEKRLDKTSQLQKDKLEKQLRAMEKWFAAQLFSDKKQNRKLSAYQSELYTWLEEREVFVNATHQKYKNLTLSFNVAKIFAALTALFMTIGSSYLLVGAFSVIPMLAFVPYIALPIIIVPTAIIAGLAYGLLIYNAVTNMIANDTLRKWFFKIRADWRDGQYARSIFIAAVSVTLALLAITLTICTAGTWWTIAQTARPLFTWMTKIPAFVMGIINPIVIGIASIIFNWQNTSETLDMIHEATTPSEDQRSFFERLTDNIRHGFKHLRKRENWLQIFNPFRFLITVTLAPLRVILFIGHLISMGVGDDRVPGIPQWIAALLGTTSEIFEDAHYFFGLTGMDHHHHHHHSVQDLLNERHGAVPSHDHRNDLPTRFIKAIFLPLYLAAAVWDFGFSKSNDGKKERLTFVHAWEKQWGLQKMQTVPPELSTLSLAWKKEQAAFAIENFKQKHLEKVMVNKPVAGTKSQALSSMQKQIMAIEDDEADLTTILDDQSKNPVYQQPRLFSKTYTGATTTELFLKKLVVSQ